MDQAVPFLWTRGQPGEYMASCFLQNPELQRKQKVILSDYFHLLSSGSEYMEKLDRIVCLVASSRCNVNIDMDGMRGQKP